jgi:hypothetical protein
MPHFGRDMSYWFLPERIHVEEFWSNSVGTERYFENRAQVTVPQFLGLPCFYSEVEKFVRNYSWTTLISYVVTLSGGHWHSDMFACVLILNSVKEPIRVLKQTMTAREVGLGWGQEGSGHQLSQAGKETVVLSFSASSLPSVAMSRTFLALFVCLAVLPTVVIPARYVPKWKKQVSIL